MKKLIVGFLLLGSISSFANCNVVVPYNHDAQEQIEAALIANGYNPVIESYPRMRRGRVNGEDIAYIDYIKSDIRTQKNASYKMNIKMDYQPSSTYFEIILKENKIYGKTLMRFGSWFSLKENFKQRLEFELKNCPKRKLFH